MNNVRSKTLSYNAAPRLAMDFIKLSADLLCNYSLGGELLEVVEDCLLSGFQHLIWHVLVEYVKF